MKVAIPCREGRLSNFMSKFEEIIIFDVENTKIKGEKKESYSGKINELPKWLSKRGVEIVIGGGNGRHLVDLFEKSGISMIYGAPNLSPEVVLKQYLLDVKETGIKLK